MADQDSQPPLICNATPATPSSGRNLGVVTLTMMTAALFFTLRNMPMMAATGLQMIFFNIVTVFAFLIPIALVAAELATAWPKNGVFHWVEEAYGTQWDRLSSGIVETDEHTFHDLISCKCCPWTNKRWLDTAVSCNPNCPPFQTNGCLSFKKNIYSRPLIAWHILNSGAGSSKILSQRTAPST